MVINGDEADSCGKTDGKVLDWKFIAWGVELAELAYPYLRGRPVYLQFWIRFQASSSSVALETQWKYEAFWIRVGRVGQVSSMSSWTKLSFRTGTIPVTAAITAHSYSIATHLEIKWFPPLKLHIHSICTALGCAEPANLITDSHKFPPT